MDAARWERVAAEEAQLATAEAASETATALRALGLDGSAARAAADAKRAALRAAKAQWAERTEQEAAAKAWVTDRVGGEHVFDALGGKEVVHVRDCVDCVFTLPSGVVLAKLFVERCTRCTFQLHGRLVTGHAEVWACVDCALACAALLPTLQADGCTRLALSYTRPGFLGAVVHAGCSLTLHVEADTEGAAGAADDLAGSLLAQAVSAQLGGGAADEQFITRLVSGGLLTERLIRDAADYPTTARELVAAAEADSPLAALSEAELAAAMAARRAALKREEGNTAFRARDYAAAAVAYTAALAAAPGDGGTLLNRAAAFLKLGRPEQALVDALAAAAAAPGNAKAQFRVGLALHALGRFSEAGAALSRAAALEGGNAAIRDALRLTEMALARQQRAGE